MPFPFERVSNLAPSTTRQPLPQRFTVSAERVAYVDECKRAVTAVEHRRESLLLRAVAFSVARDVRALSLLSSPDGDAKSIEGAVVCVTGMVIARLFERMSTNFLRPEATLVRTGPLVKPDN